MWVRRQTTNQLWYFPLIVWSLKMFVRFIWSMPELEHLRHHRIAVIRKLGSFLSIEYKMSVCSSLQQYKYGCWDGISCKAIKLGIILLDDQSTLFSLQLRNDSFVVCFFFINSDKAFSASRTRENIGYLFIWYGITLKGTVTQNVFFPPKN